jgi:hypothetical protein
MKGGKRRRKGPEEWRRVSKKREGSRRIRKGPEEERRV